MNRNTLIKLVHAGARKLFKEDDDRRAWQRMRTCRSNCKEPCADSANCTGHSSCKDMSDADMENLVAELRRKGALEPRKPPKRAGRVPFNRSPYMDKIEALLADMGLSWQYAESIAYKVTGGKGEKPYSKPGVKKLEWVKKADDFRSIIAALHVEQEKRNSLSRIGDLLKELDRDREYVEAMVPKHMKKKWQRNRAWLSIIVDRLAEEYQAKEIDEYLAQDDA